MLLTFSVFNSAYTTSKVPVSNQDNHFEFKNVQVPLDKVHLLFKENFVLSRPISKEGLFKRDNSISAIYDTMCNYCVLDFDDILQEKDASAIIDYFKNNNYSINIFKSRSYGVYDSIKKLTEYNLKGVLLIETQSTKTMTQAHLNYFSSELDGLCTLDMSSANIASYQAPSFSSDSVYYNVGVCVQEELLNAFIPRAPIKLDYDFNQESTKFFWENMVLKYNATFAQAPNTNGTINVALPNEKKSRFSYFWNPEYPWKIQHPNSNKSIDMFNDFIKTEAGKAFIKEKNIERFKKYFDSISSSVTAYQDNRYMEVNSDVLDILKTFKENSVLMVKGVMGSGKSNIVEAFNVNNKRILYITMRKTLSYDMLEKYKVKHYLEHIGNVENRFRQGDSLIVQVDSIHKINPLHFDSIVIDEFESLCLYTQSNMIASPNYIKNMKILFELFDSKKRFIVMDTFLNEFSINLYFQNKTKVLVHNTHKDESTVYSYAVKETFINVLEHKAKTKDSTEVLTCSFGTLAELEATKKLLEMHSLRVVIMSSDTPDEVKKLMQELFKDAEVNYDIVLYSPTITVGISILNNVKHHFHFDSGKSIDPISSIQMLKRSRKASNIHIYIGGDSISQKSFDPEVLNERTRLKLAKWDIDQTSVIFYNSDTNDISELGKFVNKFVAHKNFYSNNHQETCMYMLGVQFTKIIEINDETHNLKFKKFLVDSRRSLSNKDLFDGFTLTYDLDINEYDELFNKKRLDTVDKQKLVLLEIKREFFCLSSDTIVKIAKEYANDKNTLDKIKNLYFYTLKPEAKKRLFEERILSNQKNIMGSFDYSIWETLMKVKMQDLYTHKELIVLKKYDYLVKCGFKKRNKCLVLDAFVVSVVDELLKNNYTL